MVMWPRTSRHPKRSRSWVVTQISLKLNISKTVRNGWIASKLTHDGPQYSPHPWSTQGQGQGNRSRDTGTSVMSRNFAIQYRLTFCRYMHSLCEVRLQCPSTISVRQPDVMSTSWNELLRRFRCVILTANRKPHLENPVVTWPMTSRDPKGQGRDPNTFEA